MHHQDGEFAWNYKQQALILSSFFYGYVLTQIPFGMLAKRFGALGFLGWGMLLNSVFAFLVPIAAKHGIFALCVVRFIQGLGEGPIVPCTHAMLAKWIPPNERSRMGAAVYAGQYLLFVVFELEFSNGLIYCCRRSIRNNCIDAIVWSFIRIWI